MSASLTVHTDPTPLRADASGVIRVGSSRVSFDVVVEEYESGQAAEAIVRDYDTLNLADVHAAIAYYLRHRDEVRAYLRQRQEEADNLRKAIETDQRPFPTKAELLERQRQRVSTK